MSVDHIVVERSAAVGVKRWLSGLLLSAGILFLAGTAARADEAGSGTLVAIHVAGADAINAATPMFVAQRQGFFKQAGLDVSYVTMAGGDVALAAALKRGELEIGVGGAVQYMDDIAKGIDSGKLIGEFTDNVYVILGGNGIKDIKQLKGKIFGISNYNGGDQIYSAAVLRSFGIGPDDVTWLPIGTPASRVSALLSGHIDALELSITSMPENVSDRIILSPDDSPVPFVSAAIFARQDFLTNNKLALQKFLAAIGQGAAWLRSHPDDAQAGCMDSGANAAVCKTTIEIAVTSKNPYTWSSTSKLNMDAVKAMIPFVAADVPKAANMTAADFADPSVAPQ